MTGPLLFGHRHSGCAGRGLADRGVHNGPPPVVVAWPIIALGVVLAACAPHTGRLLVVVDTDLGALRLRRVDVVARRAAGGAETHTFVEPSFPFSFVVVAGSSADGVEIAASGYSLGQTPCTAPGEPVGCGPPLVTRTLVSPFDPGTTRLVLIRLDAACRGVACAEGETCDGTDRKRHV